MAGSKESAARAKMTRLASNPNYYSDIAKMVKNRPGGAFKDKDFAAKASTLGVKARKAKRHA